MKRADIRTARKKRVVIVDDSKTMQAVLDQILSQRLGVEVVGVASDAASAATMVRSLRPDLVTIDLCMPYIDGSKLLDMIADLPDLRKVIISATACDHLATVAKLEQAGADACIAKSEISRDPASFCRKLLVLLAKPKRGGMIVANDRTAPVPAGGSPSFAAAGYYPVPLDERARLAMLEKLRLANDELDPQFELLTGHMGKTTDFPTCLMTFIDKKHQWVKSAYGFARGSMPRATAFCNHTLCSDDVFIVSNAATDPRFARNALVVDEPRVRTYVGCPIVAEDGVRVGAICLIDTKPRLVSPDVITNLRSISAIAAELIRARAGALARAA